MRSLYISDLHLSEVRPESNERFFRFLEEDAAGADALYVLGDLFEYWIGDDDLDSPFNAVILGFFRRLFKRHTGAPPQAYRARFGPGRARAASGAG